MRIRLGNPKPLEGVRDPKGRTVFRPMDEATVTSFSIPGQPTTSEALSVVLAALPQLMERGIAPTWVAAEDEGIQQALASQFGLTTNPIPAGQEF